METELRAGIFLMTHYFDQTDAAAFAFNFGPVGTKQHRAFLREHVRRTKDWWVVVATPTTGPQTSQQRKDLGLIT